MTKITLNNVGSLIDATTAATTINNNFSTLQTAFDNTLSRDGTVPNQMSNTFDMNSFQILNLPTPATANSPLRLQDLTSFIGGGTITNIPAGGTAGQMLIKNSNTNYDITFTPSFKSVNPANAAVYLQLASTGLGSGVYNAFQSSIGTAITTAEQFGAGAARLDQGVVGTVSLTTSTGSAYGVTGFGKSTAGVSANAIGVGGWGYAAGTNSNAWAFAGSVHNASTLAANSGFDVNSMMGMEIDMNVRFKAAGAEPTITQLMGLNVTGGGDTAVAQGSAVSIGPLNVNNNTKWATAYNSRAGSAQVAFLVGPVSIGGTTIATQPIQFQGTDSGGLPLIYTLQGDGGKQFTIQAPANGFVGIGDTNGNGINVSATFGGSKVKFPALSVAGFITNTAAGVLNTSPFGTGVQTALGVNTNAGGGFVTSPVANANLSNSSLTIGTTNIALGATSLPLAGITALTAGVDGSTVTIGPGGTGATSSFLKLFGANASAQGAMIKFSKNDAGTTDWFLGHVSRVEAVGTSSDLEYFNAATSVRTMRLAIADDSVAFASVVDGTSGTLGAINTLGGIGVTKAVWAGTSIKSAGPTSGIGYATGAGGTIAQATSRTTGVTLNKVSGSITLFSQINAAVSAATAQTFTLTNSAIAATDVVHLTQQSGTDKYEIFVTNTAVGSCQITNYSTGGTTNEAPVFNFVVIKGVTS